MPAPTGSPGPRPFSTHGITLEEGMAVKRFRSPADGDERRLYGDEPRREWRALTLLARYAPGLAPRPMRADLDADRPLIAMSPVPGTPLGTRGRGGQATELADFTEHVTVWAHAGINADAFLDRFDLNPGQRRQITQLRRLFAAFWVMRLLPGGSAYHRNPPAPLNARQAACSTCSTATDSP